MFASHMDQALEEARKAAARGETPVGAVLSGPDGRVLAPDGNRVRELNDPTAHAEMLVIRAACEALGSERLMGCGLTVTLEPCPMCAGAIAHARISTVVFGAYDPKGGGVVHGARVFEQPTCHHQPEVIGGIQEDACQQLLQTFFQEKR